MNLSATEPGNLREPRMGPTKFLFASGARPVDGYTIKRGIGRGGFGEVYYATSDGGKEVAMKLIRRNLDVELRGVVQCLNLKHPHLLALFDIRQDSDEDTWVIMEYVGGDTLDRAIARYPQGMPADEMLTWFHGIAAGVSYLHDHGIVHRDLKPGNIFSDEGIVKLGDYGLSKFISASRRSGQTESVGTVHYMAPEVANGRYGKEIDIYALGVILYEMLTGHVPFEGESVGEVLMKHLTAKPDLNGVAEPYRSLLERVLDKDPARRPQSVAELAAALPPSGASAPAFVPPLAGHSTAPPPIAPAAAFAAAPVAAAMASNEEPIWRAVRENWHQLQHAWQTAELNWFVRAVILVVAAITVLSTSGVWISAILIYAIYRLVRSIVLAANKNPQLVNTVDPVGAAVRTAMNAAQNHPPMPTPPPLPGALPVLPVLQPLGESPLPVQLPLQSTREKTTELLGSLLLSALVSIAVCFLLNEFAMTMLPGQVAWLAIVSTLGAWAVLIPTKLWEGSAIDDMSRRCVLLLSGMALGFSAWGLNSMLEVNLPYSHIPQVRAVSERVAPPETWSRALYGADGRPTLTGCLAFFGLLMFVPRWWKLADPLRRRRLSLWNTGLYGLCGFLLSLLPFSDQFAVTSATTMALAVQLSSPWINRRTLRAHPAEATV